MNNYGIKNVLEIESKIILKNKGYSIYDSHLLILVKDNSNICNSMAVYSFGDKYVKIHPLLNELYILDNEDCLEKLYNSLEVKHELLFCIKNNYK